MGKVIQSPVKKWPGTITLKDPIPFPDFVEWEKARGAVNLLNTQGTPEGEETKKLDWFDVAAKPEYTLAMLPGLLAVVESWNLENFPASPTVETFPSTPRLAVIRLLVAVYLGAAQVIVGEDEDGDPNG